MEKHIELFTGSIRDLEYMTKETYIAILEPTSDFSGRKLCYLWTIKRTKAEVDDQLLSLAGHIEADALVNLSYFPIGFGGVDQPAESLNSIHGGGYAVKKVKPEDKDPDSGELRSRGNKYQIR